MKTQYYSIPIGGAPGFRPSISLRGLVLGAVPLVQTRGPRPLPPASKQGAPGSPASPLESPLPHWKPPRQPSPRTPSGKSRGHILPYPSSRCLRPPAVLHSPTGGALLQIRPRPALGAQAAVPPPPSPQPEPGSSPSGPLSDGRPVIMRSGERGAPRAAALTLHISDPPGPSSIRSCSLSGRLIAGGQDGWRDRQPRNP